jgi:Family of unknown function (DUF6502)
MPSSRTDEPDNAVLSALKRILGKLVRFAIRFGITYPIVEQMLKRSFVDVASSEFRLDGKEQTDSRVALLTGLNRRDVRRIRVTIHDDRPLTQSLERRVVDSWTQPPFMDAQGHRMPLPRSVSAGGELSFEALVQRVSTDIRASVLLDEWLTKGYVRIDEHDRVVFLEAYYFGRGAKLADTALTFAHSASDLIAGFTDLMANSEPRPLRVGFAYCDGLSQESVDELFITASKRVTQNTESMNRLGEELSQSDRGRPDARQRFTFCTYMYRSDMDRDPPLMRS